MAKACGELLVLGLTVPAAAQDRDDDEPEDVPAIRYRVRTEIDFDAISVDGALIGPKANVGQLGATPGGVQDSRFFRRTLRSAKCPFQKPSPQRA